MKATSNLQTGHIIIRFTVILCMLFSVSGTLHSVSGSDGIKFNHEFKLKRISGTTVSVSTIDENGEKQEYLISDFNADVLLLIYRNLNIQQITGNLSKKYHLKEKDCRRHVKMAINTLEEWDIIFRS
jgi:hypothetical protein